LNLSKRVDGVSPRKCNPIDLRAVLLSFDRFAHGHPIAVTLVPAFGGPAAS
jgi:hypothetical protein